MTYQSGTSIPYQVQYYNFGGDGFWIENDCPYTKYGDIPVPLPLGLLMLTKE